MKRFICALFALIIAASVCITAVASDTVTVDMSTTYQTIDGFGAAYTWYSDRLLNHNDREALLDEIFLNCNFNILRFIHLQENKTKPTTMETYKAYYDAAVERGIAPLVMVTHCGAYVTGYDFSEFVKDLYSGTTFYALKKDENGEYMYDVFAEHCVNAVKEFLDAGIPVDYFSFANEVEHQEKKYRPGEDPLEYSSFFWGTEEDEYHPAYWKAHAAIYYAFELEFGDEAPEILGAEAMNGKVEVLAPYLDPLIENHPDMLKTVAFHLYGTNRTEETFSAVDEHFEEYDLWQTEWCSDDYFDNAETIIDELNNNLNAYIYWNGVWAPDLGMCLIEFPSNSADTEVRFNGSHYIMMHFSKYIDRGYQRVELTEELGSKLVAFKAPDNSRLVIVAMNSTAEAENFVLDLGSNEILDSQVYQSIEADNHFKNEYWNELGEYYEPFGIDLPAGSLTTIVLNFTEQETTSDTSDSNAILWGVAGGTIAVIVVGAVVIAVALKRK